MVIIYLKIITTVNDLFTWIDDELNKRGWSDSELARRGGISQSTVSMVRNGQRGASQVFCRAIAKAFDEPPERVLRLAGLLPPLPAGEDPSIAELDEMVARMTPEQRLELLRYGEYLRQRDREAKSGRSGSVRPGYAGSG